MLKSKPIEGNMAQTMQHREETGEAAGGFVLRSLNCACAHVAPTSRTKGVKSQSGSEAMWDFTASLQVTARNGAR